MEEKALRAYMLYGRPLMTKCENLFCPVFVTHTNASPEEWCIKLHISNTYVILKNVAVAAGVTTTTVNSRMLRRSTISAAWKRNSGYAFRQELSQLAGHTYKTAGHLRH